MTKPLSAKHLRFVDEYLKCWNGTRAYMKVYPSAEYNSARANAAKLLASTSISEVIAERLAESTMQADEALSILAAHARGDIAKLMEIRHAGFSLDLMAAKEAGMTRIIRKVKQRTTTFIAKGKSEEDREVTETELELYDAQAAAVHILKILGRYVEKVQIGKEINVEGVDAMLDKIYGETKKDNS